ncbi:helix-turn-helix domain-containing protein [Vibrio mediterranei]|uniref:Transcriptional regulator n=1 Tax=Vibrio mediterranei TaxID=689 RepID=A0AAN1FN93_9VIBR|nr:XRE family transcriptional regulator [Vibrio mediterranei]ASI93395.1 transcriptional regulator [Vibrio mediterranei]ASI93442.1 transcriptional regulator [Vibrio mediterranei]NOI26870.1 XRE family transcriptional regulator [Vibrio mediterranei]
MALKFYDSPFHVTHDEKVATKMALKMDLSIMISEAIDKKGWTQQEAADFLGVARSRVSELKNHKIELFTIDAMFDMLDKFGFRTKTTNPSLTEATIVIAQPLANTY